MFGKKRKFRKAEKYILQAVDMMRYFVEYIDRTGRTQTKEYLSLARALDSIQAEKRNSLSSVIISEGVPETDMKTVLFTYDVRKDILTSPHL